MYFHFSRGSSRAEILRYVATIVKILPFSVNVEKIFQYFALFLPNLKQQQQKNKIYCDIHPSLKCLHILLVRQRHSNCEKFMDLIKILLFAICIYVWIKGHLFVNTFFFLFVQRVTHIVLLKIYNIIFGLGVYCVFV